MAEIKKVIRNGTTYDIFNSDNVDSALSTSSTNAIQNGAVATALDTKITNPSGGTTGQVLTKTAQGEEWDDVEALPDGGEVGNKLAKTATGSEWVDGELVEITEGGFDYPAMRGPCSEGFHVPTNDEWNKIRSILNDKDIRIYLKMPLAGFHNWTGSGWSSQGTKASYFSCTVNESTNKPGGIYSTGTYTVFEWKQKDMLSSIRPFKDTPVIPDNTWTVLDGTLGSAGIFWSSSLGLISLTSDGTDYITIADKNSGANTVYNNGDNLTNNNCGYQYQRGNNYGVYYGATLTTSSTRVDASGYGPGNYYSSSTIIFPRDTTNFDWSSVRNDNLRGGVTGVILGGKYVGEDRIKEVPTDGTVGQVLTKTNNGYGFQNVVNSINGKTGNVKNAILNIPYATYSKVYDNTATLGSSTSEHSIGSTQVIASPSGTKIILYIITINGIVLYKRLFSGYSSANDSFDILSINTSSNAIEAYMRVGIHYYGSGNITKEAIAIKHPSSRSSVTIKETIYCFTQ